MDHDYNFDETLESAIIANWPDLMRGAQSGLIHVEYDFTASDTLDSLQVWSSITRGHWLLACGYQRVAPKFLDTGVHFHNGYQSEGLARILELMIVHQKALTFPQNLGRAGLLQIATPTQAASEAAAISLNETFDGIN